MIIFTDKDNIICAINECERTDVTQHEIENEMFEGKCLDFITGHKYELNYSISSNSETGEINLDEDGNPIYNLDENGEKIVVGYSIYPYIDYNQLCLIQAKYERNIIEEENTQLQLALCEQYEENLILASDLENTQLALCDVYEQLINVTNLMEGE